LEREALARKEAYSYMSENLVITRVCSLLQQLMTHVPSTIQEFDAESGQAESNLNLSGLHQQVILP
jgi:hypothetical protein